MPDPRDDLRDLKRDLDGLAVDIRDFLALVKLRFLLVETRLQRLEHRDAPVAPSPPRRCRRPRRRGPHGGEGGGEVAPLA